MLHLCLLEGAVLWLLGRDFVSLEESDLCVDLTRQHTSSLWSLVLWVCESDLLMLPVVHLVVIEAVLPLDFDLSNVGSSLDKGALCLLNHEQLQEESVSVHMHVLACELVDRNATIHHAFVPVEILDHEADHILLESHCALLCEVGDLELVHANWFAFDPCKVLKVDQIHHDLSYDVFDRQFSFLDKCKCLFFSALELVFVGGIEAEIFENHLVSVMLVKHLGQLLLVLLVEALDLELFGFDRRLLRVFREAGSELLLGNLAVSVLIKDGVDNSPQLLVDIDADCVEHFKHLRVRHELLVIIGVESVEELGNGVFLLVDVGGDVSQCLLLDSLSHCPAFIDSEHHLGDLLLLHVSLHVGEASDAVHSNIVSVGGIVGFKHSVELSLVDVFVDIAVVDQLLLE